MGAIYLTIQNLPREQRFKEENAILVGVMPGPKEPSLSINSYLLPLIQELNKLYCEGLSVLTPQNTHVTVRVALSCISCDIPASRKVCGYLSHNARFGCNKCFKEFLVSASGSSDFSGYDKTKWKSRTGAQHRADCLKLESEVTKTGLRAAESRLGVRYSALLQLSYYDPVQFVALDLMHNLFLGTGKHMFSVWIELGLLSKSDLSSIEKVSKTFVVPRNVGRLPLNIGSNYSGFKAAQWSTWITIYSPVVLKQVLPDPHYNYWLLFVRACVILTQRIIKVSDVNTADKLLENFCKQVQQECGAKYCTPNMHLHLHLKDTLLNFGPAHSTWCFSFERYNGILGSISTNSKSIESQFLNRFVRAQLVQSKLSMVDDPELLNLIPKATEAPIQLTPFNSDSELLHLLQLSRGNLNLAHDYSCRYTNLLEPCNEFIFTEEEIFHLTSLYQQLNPDSCIEYVSPFYVRSGRISFRGDIIGSTLNNRSAQSSSAIAAYWPVRGSCITNFDQSRASIGRVMYYFNHSVTLHHNNNETSNVVQYTLAYVRWMDYHHQNSLYGISATVCANSYKEASLCCFIPVLRIFAKCANCIVTLRDEDVFVACPIPLKLSI